jgi:hypothetical protein
LIQNNFAPRNLEVGLDDLPRRGRSIVTPLNAALRCVLSASSDRNTPWYSQVST